MKKRMILISVVVLTAFTGVAIAASTPGSDGDPIITLSYFQKGLQEMTDKINVLSSMVEQNNTNLNVMDKKVEEISNRGGQGGAIFEIVNLTSGKSLIGENSTEIILRSGKARAVSSNASGLSDVTSGLDIAPGAAIEKNHLLLVPRTDGRGISAQTTSIVLVRGKYTIE